MSKRTTTTFRGWKVVGAGAVVQGLQSAFVMHSLGAYLVELEREYGWSKTALSGAFALNRAETALLGPAQGWLIDRFGPKAIVRAGAVAMAAGFVWFSQLQSLWQFYGAFFVMAVGSALCGMLTVTVAIVRWFERLRARALAFGGMGLAAGGVCVPLVVLSFSWFGWRATAAATGVGGAVVAWWLAKYLDGRPGDFGQEVDGGAKIVANGKTVRAEGVSDVHFTAKEAMRTRAFWTISFGHLSALFVVGAVMAHLQLYLTSERGYTLQQASLFAAALPLMQLAGMAVGGWLGDRINKRLIASVAMFGHAGGILLLAWAPNAFVVVLFVIFHGFAWGARGPLMQALRADYFGSSAFAAIMGVSSLIVMIGPIVGPLAAGWLADTTGSYVTGFVALAVLTSVGMLFFVITKPPALPERGDGLEREPRAGASSAERQVTG
ncbi:MFS transporter [Candidatus Poriferisodalis sp.]|uniref:MFS transporter n=1 Tax=Candidatus Poriferisodalis sp. TaxID=3101277 RepID=UPI003B02436B